MGGPATMATLTGRGIRVPVLIAASVPAMPIGTTAAPVRDAR